MVVAQTVYQALGVGRLGSVALGRGNGFSGFLYMGW